MYDIEIDYTTGNSFGSERSKEPLCNPVTTLEMAKENLKRIKKHYLECADNPNYDKRYDLVLLIDDGERKITPFWIGYFETLHGAKVFQEMDEEMEFELY